jgi:hypothetical protein
MSTDTRRGALTALAGLLALALPGAIASSDAADGALVDLGVLAQCDDQETLCPEDLEPREQSGNIAATRALRGRGESCGEVILKLAAAPSVVARNDQREKQL